jgi:hypothetical protein
MRQANSPLRAVIPFVLALLFGSAVDPYVQNDLASRASERSDSLKPDTVTMSGTLENYAKLPLRFEANRGQIDSRVKFLSRGSGYTLFLTSTEGVLALRNVSSTHNGGGSKSPAVSFRRARKQGTSSVTSLRMRLVGANPDSQAVGVEELPGKNNYFIGNDPKKWRTNVPTYAKVQYVGVYPGVDLVYYGNQGQLEYDFVVMPGADPRGIQMAFGGRLRLRANGDLAIRIKGGEVRIHRPVAYQTEPRVESRPGARLANDPSRTANGARIPVCESRIPVEARYTLWGHNRIGFALGAYDHRRPLVIDPALVYSTYLGGSGTDYGASIAVDGLGNAYVSGQTFSADFPVTAGALQTECAGGCARSDAFVAKLNPSGSALVYSTYLGGSGDEIADGVVLDASGSAYLSGQTYSSDFPSTPGAFQTACGGGNCAAGDAFVAKLDSSGSTLLYSTYLGGGAYDQGNAIALDASGNAYVTGTTCSADFPATAGSFQTKYGGDAGKCGLGVPSGDGFVAELNSSGSALVYATYLGGSNGDFSYAIALDQSGDAYLAGATFSSDFPTTPGAFQTGLGANATMAGWASKLNSTGSALVYSTYLGGSGQASPCDTCATGVAVDSAGNAYVSGLTLENDFPTTPGAFQTSHVGSGHDAFVTKLNDTGSRLLYSTYLGGSMDDGVVALALDTAGRVCVLGITSSSDFPITSNAFQKTFGGATDIFVTVLNPSPNQPLVYSTYLGGSRKDYGMHGTASLALGGTGVQGIYLTGYTASTNFPIGPGAFQPTFGGGSFDAFIAKLTP